MTGHSAGERLIDKMSMKHLDRQSGDQVGPVDSLVMPLGMSKIPVGWPLMAQAFLDFALWAIGKPEMVESFQSETGINMDSPKTAIDAMIDAATGAKRAKYAAFLDWLTVNHWGEA